jgi:hypothetical protein
MLEAAIPPAYGMEKMTLMNFVSTCIMGKA